MNIQLEIYLPPSWETAEILYRSLLGATVRRRMVHKKIQAAFVIKAEDFKLRCSRSSTGGSVLMNFKLIGKCVIAPYETKSNTTWSLLIFSLT